MKEFTKEPKCVKCGGTAIHATWHNKTETKPCDMCDGTGKENEFVGYAGFWRRRSVYKKTRCIWCGGDGIDNGCPEYMRRGCVCGYSWVEKPLDAEKEK